MNKKTIFTKARRKCRGRGGFSFVEALLATAIMLLMSLVMASGVDFAVTQYHNAVIRSESKVLCSTLANIVRAELGNTGTIKPGERVNANTVKVDSFFSRTYANKASLSRFYSVTVDEYDNVKPASGYGELLLGTEKDGVLVGKLLLSSAAYSTYHLGAKIGVTYDETREVFHVALSICGPDRKETLAETFDVIPLNDLAYVS